MNWDSFLGALSFAAFWILLTLIQDFWWNPRHFCKHANVAAPHIQSIIRHVDDLDLPIEQLHRAVTAHRSGVDDTAMVITMAAALLEVGSRAGMSTREVVDMFEAHLPESIEDEL
jgi:hypothetical protein